MTLQADLTLAVLSWGARKTLRNTLGSYQKLGLDELASQKIIYFQEIRQEDKYIAHKYGYDYIGGPENIGIAQAYKRLVEKSTGSLFLFLENDWELIERAPQAIYDGIWMLNEKYGDADVVRYRHRNRPGNPLWTIQYKGTELERPEFLLDSIHWTRPSKFPQIREVIYSTGFDDENRTWYVTSARYANWTNNPTMFRTDWLREHIVPRLGTRNVEIDLQEWWREQDFGVAQSEGLFTHNRIG